MTRGTVACCRCGAQGHIADACPEPPGAEYVPEPAQEPAGQWQPMGEAWHAYMALSEEQEL